MVIQCTALADAVRDSRYKGLMPIGRLLMDHSSRPATLNLTPIPERAQAKFSDTLAIYNERHTLYLGDNWSGGVDVLDISTKLPTYVKTVKLRGRVYGIAVAANVDKVFVGMTGSLVAVIDVASDDTLIDLVNTGGAGHADLLDYDPAHRRLFVANRLDGLLTWIDAGTNQLLGRVDGLGGGLEQPRYNSEDGLVYLSDNRENVLYQIDPETARLIQKFEIGVECFPNGLAIRAVTNHALLISSSSARPHVVIWDLARQRIESVTYESGCGDGAIYVPSVDRFFAAASGFGDGPVMGIFGGDPVQLLMNVPTSVGSSWVDFDIQNALVYAPTIVGGKPGVLSFEMPSL
jgi:hypothetical protein